MKPPRDKVGGVAAEPRAGAAKRAIRRACLAALLVACASPPNTSPRSVADAVIKALDQGDVQRFLAVLPTEDQLGEAFDCGHADTLRAALRRRLDDLRAELEARREAHFRTRLLGWDEDGSETVELEPGDVFMGCAARVPLTVHRSRLTLQRTRGGRNDNARETWTFLRFESDGPWYFGKL